MIKILMLVAFIAHAIYSPRIERNITTTPQASLTNFYFLCQARTTPKPLFTWTKNKVAVQPSNRIRFLETSGQQNTRNSYLIFSPVENIDQGEYVCNITQTVTGVYSIVKSTLGKKKFFHDAIDLSKSVSTWTGLNYFQINY